MRKFLGLSAALILFGVLAILRSGFEASSVAAPPCPPHESPCFPLVSTIAFTSTRQDPSIPVGQALEIYLMNADGTNVRRLTDNTDGEAFAALSPDGKGKIIFDSNRARLPDEPGNTSDLFIMNKFGGEQTYLTRGSGATWSPDSHAIAYQRSASGHGLPMRPEPGAPTPDSDIFVIDNLGDFQDGLIQPRNLTSSPDKIDEDPDWSPTGDQIAYTSKNPEDNPFNSTSVEIYVRNADGSGTPTRLTFNSEDERGLTWSPDGTKILYMCRHGGPDFELCVINADGTGFVQLTNDSTPELTPTWSPDGSEIVFHNSVAGSPPDLQLFRMNADGTGLTQITTPPGINGWAKYGVIRDTGN